MVLKNGLFSRANQRRDTKEGLERKPTLGQMPFPEHRNREIRTRWSQPQQPRIYSPVGLLRYYDATDWVSFGMFLRGNVWRTRFPRFSPMFSGHRHVIVINEKSVISREWSKREPRIPRTSFVVFHTVSVCKGVRFVDVLAFPIPASSEIN